MASLLHALVALWTLFLVLPFCCAHRSLADELFLRFLPPNAAAQAIAPPSISSADTVITVRYTLIGAVAIYDPQAACQPRALSFFGTRDFIPKKLCDPDKIAIVRSYATYRALRREFPTEAAGYAKFLVGLGLNPFSNSRDRSTISGWGNFAGDRIANYFANDGWNSLGNRGSRFVGQQFADYTNYRPANCPSDNPRNLARPLRWQPFVFPDNSYGRFKSQVHILPHIGITVKPLVLSDREVESRAVRSPYAFPNARNRIAAVDVRRIKGYLNVVLGLSARLTSFQRFLARWWDNKLLSTAGISAFYEIAGNFSRFESAQQFLGEMISQHDAVIVAWREKRRFDTARPRTLLVNLGRGSSFRAFVSEEVGFRQVKAEEWRPLIDEQPHSEYPSGSAALCTAALEHLEVYVSDKRGSVPPINIRYPAGVLPSPPIRPVARTVAFSSPAEAARSCADSRLLAGVHFPPAIAAGKQIGSGIGKIVFEHMKLLGDGVVPPNCGRCQGERNRRGRTRYEQPGFSTSSRSDAEASSDVESSSSESDKESDSSSSDSEWRR